jgi:putative ABC transport system substrate-binding protein
MKRREFIAGLGGAAAWPFAVRAQERALPVVGYLTNGSDPLAGIGPSSVSSARSFLRGLGEQGFVEGRNVEILYRFGQTQNDRLLGLAADLVRRRVTVIFAVGLPSVLAAKAASATIPVVFLTGADPVESKLVASLNRPGGNITGTTILTTELAPKRLGLIREIVPTATSIGYLANPTDAVSGGPTILKALETAARTLGVRLPTALASTADEIEPAVAMLMLEGISALLVGTDSFFNEQSAQLIALTTRHRLPAIYAYRETVEVGGLISYGTNFEAYRLAGNYTGRILKGEKPADLPVQQVTKIDLVINLKAAKALNLTIPETLLATADEVIQ